MMLGRMVLPLAAGLVCWSVSALSAGATVDECLECHGEEGLEREEGGVEGELLVDPETFPASIHAKLGCTGCHKDAVLRDGEHAKDLKTVRCAQCHEKAAEVYAQSLHGEAREGGDEMAPYCWDCHTKHAVFPPRDPRSSIYKFNIPATCSRCHQEGSEVTRTHALHQKNVVKNYSMSIHGVGLFRRGLTVAAVCTDCHGSHLVLPPDEERSSINRDRIAGTCMQCHGEIERVHRKVIRGELWEKQPHAIPACIECHPPHEVRRVVYEEAFTDADCLKCHGPEAETVARDAKSGRELRVDTEELHGSAHRQLRCVKCHSGASAADDPPCTHAGEVDCTACHAEQGEQYATSTHGTYRGKGDRQAPDCRTCHGTHGVIPPRDPDSPVNPANVPTLCGRCHQEGEAAAKRYTGNEHEIIGHYRDSIHGKGLLESGLLVTATCASCHTAHMELPASDARSTVNRDNLPETCGACHAGVQRTFKSSIHSPLVSEQPREKLPSCKDCHSSHTISRTDQEDFRTHITDQCGRCHEKVTESYFDTYHGKVSLLGSGKTAKCSDCHGSHNILPPTMPASTLSRDHIVKTCAKCHEGSHKRFAGYLTHATHHDPDKYPAIYYTFWGMTLLLLGTLTFFGLHTLLWLPRSLREMRRLRRKHREEEHVETRWVQRFRPYHRVTHVLVIVSFFTLAITGMALKFSYAAWAQTVSAALGGFEAAGTLHRLAALVTFVYFAMHLGFVFREWRRQGKRLRDFIFGPETIVPNWRDVKEFIGTVKWFLGRGPRPEYGRWTYWEKFDYLAVFWGVAVIGLSGLILWFPELFTYLLPGWAINVATIIHSDEALLAAGFIFTIHFFNTHFRPEKFPMDPVIFTGRVRLDEFIHERPREYQQLVEDGKLEELLVTGPTPQQVRLVRILGLSALVLGLTLVGLIAYSMLFAYR